MGWCEKGHPENGAPLLFFPLRGCVMRRLLWLLFPILLSAEPMWNSGPGFPRTLRPWPLQRGNFLAGITSGGLAFGDTFRLLDLNFALRYDFNDHLGTYLSLPIYADEGVAGVGDLEAGLLFPFLGGQLRPFFTFPTGTPDTSAYRWFSTGTFDLGLYYLRSFGENLHLNLGWVDRELTRHITAHANQVLIRLAASLGAGPLRPYIELSYDWFIDPLVLGTDPQRLGGSPLRLGAGLAFQVGELQGVIGGAYYLTKRKVNGGPTGLLFLPKEDLAYEVNLALYYGRQAQALGIHLFGTVVDRRTGEPVVAELVIPELDLYRAAVDGRFDFGRIPPGIYSVAVSAPGYRPLQAKVTIPPGGKEQPVEIRLEPVRRALVRGRVLDKETGGLIEAALELDGKRLGSLSTFAVEVDPGTHVLVARKTGYRTVRARFSVSSGDTLDLKLQMPPR